MAARAVSATQVVEAVRSSSIVDSPGLIDDNHMLELTLVSGQPKTPAELDRIVESLAGSWGSWVAGAADGTDPAASNRRGG